MFVELVAITLVVATLPIRPFVPAHMEGSYSMKHETYRGYTLRITPELIGIYAIGEHPYTHNSISTATTEERAKEIIDYWLEGSVR